MFTPDQLLKSRLLLFAGKMIDIPISGCNRSEMLILFLCMLVEPPYVGDAGKTFDFANHLYKNGKYESSMTEYERVLFLVRDDSAARGIDTSAVLLQMGRACLWLNDHDRGFRYLKRTGSDTSRALIGFSLLDERDFASAESVFARVGDSDWRVELISRSSRLRNLPRKSPLVAGLASTLLPGSGRALCGRFADGIFAFLFTAGSFALAYHYYDTGNEWAAAGFGGAGLFFHLGDIYGSVTAARLHNQRSYYDELDRFKVDFAPVY